ncbi:MAG TPA: COX15/CtaA family protein [Acidimicrobiia bacterium]|nr:COX15/CtaA family protein [Acidimicrobiia bacterium]
MSAPSRRFAVSPRTYRHISLVAALFIAVIIVSGAAVRLTESGLGCPSWPNCAPGRLTPRSASDVNGMIEFVNRAFTGLVSLAVIVAVLGACFRRPYRRDLVWLSLGLVAGVIGQIVLGGITVLVDLHPVAVMSHFLLSMLLLADAIVLYHRAGVPDGAVERPAVDRRIVRMGWVLVTVVSVVVVTGSVVTNTGPHAGDAEAKRFDLYLPSVARAHAGSAIVLLVLILVVGFVAFRFGVPHRLERGLTVLFAVVVAQGAIGYIQYFNGVPALLVGFHVAGATAVFAATLAFALSTYRPVPASEGAA